MENVEKYLNSNEVPQIVKDAIIAKSAYEKADDAVYNYFEPIISEKLEQAHTQEDILIIKESLRCIHPDLVCKVFLFYKIIKKEKELAI